MARKIRIYYPGALYHVMLRGNHGAQIFCSDDDRRHIYTLLQDGVTRFGHRIHAFCLMSNHIHLAIQVGDITLSKIVQNLAFRYAKWVNTRMQRIGHLFQGRHKAILIDIDNYLLNVIRYIHLNPVKANIVSHPDIYPWSSHRAYLGADKIPWLTTDLAFSLFSEKGSMAREKYHRFIQEGIDEPENDLIPAENLSKYDILGDDKFLEQLSNPSFIPKPDRMELFDLVEIVAGYYSVSSEQLRSPSRQRRYSKVRHLICLIAKEMNIATPTAVALYFCRDPSRFLRIMQRENIPDELQEEFRKLKQIFGISQ